MFITKPSASLKTLLTLKIIFGKYQVTIKDNILKILYEVLQRNLLFTSQYLSDKISSPENPISETGSFSSVTSSSNCVTKKEIEVTSKCGREHLKTETKFEPKVCCFFFQTYKE